MLLLRIFLPFSLGYYLSYLYRSINAVIYRDLVQDLSLAASSLGLVTSAYFVVFALVQLPLGLALDRFGPRRVDSTLLLAAAAGAFAVSVAATVEHLVLARALIGLGVSAALMGSMKAFTQWYPPERLPAMNGLLLAVGGLGAITATAPVEAALRIAGWRGVFEGLAVLTLLVAATIFFVTPERSGAHSNETLTDLVRGSSEVLTSSRFWRVATMAMVVLGTSLAFQGLWIAPWLRDHLGMERAAIANALFVMMIAMTLGFLGFGVAAGWLAARGVPAVRLLTVSTGLSVVVLAVLACGVTTGAVALWIAHCFLATGATLGFVILNPRFPVSAAGRVSTSLNMGTFVIAFAAQFGIGPVLEHWPAIEGR